MTIYVEFSKCSQIDQWEYEYIERFNMIVADRLDGRIPYTTLQGVTSLNIKTDIHNIISHFETVGWAEINYWTIVPYLEIPSAEIGQLMVLQDIDDGQPQAYFTNPDYSVFYTRLGEPVDTAKLQHVAIGQQIIVDATQDGMLAGVWMSDLPVELRDKYVMKSV
ncbi:MAG: hypothetical protein H6641_07640 [Caldilineaceae bacterium]|nr:hypothetical protein [Caldilineaceae bacterium]